MGCKISTDFNIGNRKTSSREFFSPHSTRELLERSPDSTPSTSRQEHSKLCSLSTSCSSLKLSPPPHDSSSSVTTLQHAGASMVQGQFTQREIAAFNKTFILLVHAGWLEKISKSELLVTVMNSNLHPFVACEKYQVWMKANAEVGLHSFCDVWRGTITYHLFLLLCRLRDKIVIFEKQGYQKMMTAIGGC